jgi:hypothetical protein
VPSRRAVVGNARAVANDRREDVKEHPFRLAMLDRLTDETRRVMHGGANRRGLGYLR